MSTTTEDLALARAYQKIVEGALLEKITEFFAEFPGVRLGSNSVEVWDIEGRICLARIVDVDHRRNPNRRSLTGYYDLAEVHHSYQTRVVEAAKKIGLVP